MVLLGRPGSEDVEALRPGLGHREVADQLAAIVQHRGEGQAPLLRHAVRQQAVEPGFGVRPGHLVFREAGDLAEAHALAHRLAFRLHRPEGVGALEGHILLRLRALRREPQRHLQTEGRAEDGAVGLHALIDRRLAQAAGGRQFLVRVADAEATRIVLAHLGLGIGHRRPVAEARDIHAPDVEARIALRHPVGEREPDAAALAEARHHGAGDPVVLEAPDRPDQRVAVGREGEGSIDDLLDSGFLEGGEMLEAHLQRRRDAVEVRLQQLVTEAPGRFLGGPGPACALIGAHQHAAALLAHVDLALEIDGVQHLLAGALVDFLHLRHVLGQEVHVLHRQKRQFEPDHPPAFARPKTAGIDHMLGMDRALLGHHVPTAVRAVLQVGDAVAQVDLRPLHARRLGIGMRRARRVEMAFQRAVEGALEAARVHQREELGGFLGRDQLAVDAEQLLLRPHHLQEVDPVVGAGQQHAARQVEAAGLAGDLLDLLVELDRVLLQFGDVGVAVDGVEAAGRVPGRPGGELRTLDQHHVLPARLGQVIEHAAPDHAAADHGHLHLAFHRWKPRR
jgi:hypothetical protein